MVRYEVTIDILADREAEWVQYMLDGHIKAVLDTACFNDFNFRKEKPKKEGYARYVIDYFCDTMQDYERYMSTSANRLRAEHTEKFDKAFEAGRNVVEYTDVVAEVYYGGRDRDHSDPTLDRVRAQLQLQ